MIRFQNFFTDTHDRKFAIRRLLKIATHLKDVAALSFQKLYRPKAQQRHAKRACAKENVIAVDERVSSQSINPSINCSKSSHKFIKFII